MRSLYPIIFVVLSIGVVHRIEADVIYEFSGTLPTINLTNTHTAVASGERWTVRLGIDTSASDANTSPIIGDYANAVVSAHLKFSGGYEKTFSFLDPDRDVRNIVIHDDHLVTDDTDRDMVYADVKDDTVYGLLRVSALVFGAKPVPVLSSDVLPSAPKAFSATPGSPTVDPELVFFFSEETGKISYTTDAANDVSFAAVPEPASLTIWITAAVVGLVFYRRRRRA